MSTRIVCKDGLTYSGDCVRRRTDNYRVYLLGHSMHIWRRSIQDLFEFDGRWRRVMGDVSAYDSHIAAGGTLWPGEFFRILYSNDI